MDILRFILLAAFVIHLIKMFFDGFAEKEEKAAKEAEDNKNIQERLLNICPSSNYTNGYLVKAPLRIYYQSLLNLNEEKEINPDVIYHHYYQLVEQSETDETLGLKTKHNIRDLFAAKEYLTDLCKYIGNRN